MFPLNLAVRRAGFQFEHIRPTISRCGTIEGEYGRHRYAGALPEVGRHQRALLEAYGAVSGNDDEPKGRQRPRRAVWAKIDVGAHLRIAARLSVELAVGLNGFGLGRRGNFFPTPR